MPESTVLDSVFGALGSIASASDRRASEGLKAAQAEEVAIRNTASKKIIEQNTAIEIMSQIESLKLATTNDDGSSKVDIVGLIKVSPALAAKFLAGENVDGWFNHTDPSTGNRTNNTFSHFVEVPAEMGGAPAEAPAAAPSIGAMPSPMGQLLDTAQGPISLRPGEIPQPLAVPPAAVPSMGTMPSPASVTDAAAASAAATNPANAYSAASTAAATDLAARADAPAAPKRYMMMLRNEKGELVPATKLGTKDPKDPLIIIDEEQLEEKGRLATARHEALGGMHNDSTLRRLQTEYTTTMDEFRRQEILNKAAANLDFSAEAKREFLEVLGTATGKELLEMAAITGVDLSEAEEKAQTAWTAQVVAKAEKANLNPKYAYDYEGIKGSLQDLVAKSEKALADYDAKAPKPPVYKKTPDGTDKVLENTAAKAAAKNLKEAGITQTMQDSFGGIGAVASDLFSKVRDSKSGVKPTTTKPTTTEKAPKSREDLETAVSFAKSALSNLVRPEVMDALVAGMKEPAFEWTDDNIRASIRGELDQPTPEQSAALAQYGQSMGIKLASDFSRLPPARAKMLQWAIVANSGGTPDEKMKMFESLNNYGQTGEPGKSAIEATTSIATAQAAVSNARTNIEQVAVQRENNQLDHNVAMAGVMQKDLDYARLVYKDKQDIIKEIDAASEKVAPLLDAIYEGTIVDGGKFKPEGPSQKAFSAFKRLDTNISLPPGSPLMYASSKRYLEGFMTMAMSQAQKPGATAWWDWTKAFANTFLREDGMIDLSPLVEQAYVKKWKNGLPEEIGFSEGGARSGKPTTVVGAAEFSRYMGTSGMQKFMESIYFQKAANALGSGATPEAIAAKSLEIKKADGYEKPY